MPAQIDKDINQAVNHEMARHHKTRWRLVLDTILSRHINERDDAIITIVGPRIVSAEEFEFETKLEIPLGKLREMAKE